MKILLDTNIILDVLQQKEPWCNAGKEIFLSVAVKQYEGFITAKQAADIHFFARRQFRGEDHADEKARRILSGLFALFGIIDTLGEDCKSALTFPNNDYEDAILIASAERTHMDCIITRNPVHYKSSPVRILQPEEFLKFADGMGKNENI